MPRPPIVRSRRVITALTRAGFQPVNQEGCHIKMRHPDGRIAILVDYGSRDDPTGTLRRELGRFGLSSDEFRRLREG